MFYLGCARQPKQVLQESFLPEIGSFMAWFLANEMFTRKLGLLLVVCIGRSANRTALARFSILVALILAVKAKKRATTPSSSSNDMSLNFLATRITEKRGKCATTV